MAKLNFYKASTSSVGMFHLLECVYGLKKLSQHSSRPQPLARVYRRLHSVQVILESAGKHGMSGYRLVLLEDLSILSYGMNKLNEFFISSALDGSMEE